MKTSKQDKEIQHESKSGAEMGVELGQLLQRPLPSRGDAVEDDSAVWAGVHIGRVVQAGGAGLLLQMPHLPQPLPAVALTSLQEGDVGRACAVLFIEGDPTKPLVVGCIADENSLPVAKVPSDTVPSGTPHEVRVDGQVVRIQAEQELELRCGASVIILQRDGHLEIRGNYVTSQASATQRIRGGSVHLN